MQRAIDETERRRNKQIEHNKSQGVVPKTIFKDVADILEGARVVPGKKTKRSQSKVAEPSSSYLSEATSQASSPKEITALISELENRMFDHAQNLEFEQAAQLRDEVNNLRDRLIEIS